jgi:hypothetical protein
MMLGLIAVFAAIVYKVNATGHAPALAAGTALPLDGRIAIPKGMRVAGSSLQGDRALLTLVADDGSTTLLLVDLRTGAAIGRYAVEAAP